MIPKGSNVTPENLKVGLAVTLKDECRKGNERYYFRITSVVGEDVQLKGFATTSGKVPVDKIWYRNIKTGYLYKCYEIIDENIVELLYGQTR